MKAVKICIMAGGAGTRFWPMSSEEKPKQFLDVLGRGKTLLQMTVDRAKGLTKIDDILVLTQEKYSNLVLEQCPELTSGNLLFETERKNTAPALAYACVKIMEEDPDAIMMVLSSDHLIDNETRFAELANKTIGLASRNEAIYTIGIRPTAPHTGYGYMQYDQGDTAPYRILRFVEKPSLPVAEEYLLSGDYLWNAGIFVWQAKAIAQAFMQYAPDIYNAFLNISIGDIAAVKKAFSAVRAESIDFAVMEQAKNIFTIEADFGWDDLGSWGSVYALSPKDKSNNAIRSGIVAGSDNKNNFVIIPPEKKAIIRGLDGFSVVWTEEGLLIYPLNKEQEIKQDLKELDSPRT